MSSWTRSALAFGSLLLCWPGPVKAEDAAAVAHVIAANQAFDAALSHRDIDAIDRAWVHDGTVTAIHPSGKAVVKGWSDVRKSWEKTFSIFSELSVTLADPQVRLQGDTAVVTGIEAIKGTLATGQPVAFNALTTNVYHSEDGRWLMVHHQASRSPQ